MNTNEFEAVTINFEGIPVAEQNILARELSDKLLAETKRKIQSNVRQEIRVDVHKADSCTMDMGSIIDISLIIGHLPETVIAHLVVEFFLKHGLKYTGKLAIMIVCRVRNKNFRLVSIQDEIKLRDFLKQCLEKDKN
ncbi:MAG: hypothetical protein BWK78_04835 [Thiotrichaceae bacterium IS1]|nr:MAG: hypothetical protein BWK78_04835 [Thiotrichaceae bacterium IS1]